MPKLERFLVFKYESGCCLGGWRDFYSSCATLEEAHKIAENGECDTAQIIDTFGEIVDIYIWCIERKTDGI